MSVRDLKRERERLLREIERLDLEIQKAKLDLAERIPLSGLEGVPKMAVNAMRERGILTLADAIRLGWSRLSQIPNVGRKAVEAIFDAFENLE